MDEEQRNDGPGEPLRRETLVKLALAGGGLLVAGWAALAVAAIRSAPSAAARTIRTGIRRSALGRSVRTLARVVLWRGADGEPVALDRRCTHLGCHVVPAPGGGFSCPCHGSRFDREGRVTHGPAARPLRRLRTSVTPQGEVVVHVEG